MGSGRSASIYVFIRTSYRFRFRLPVPDMVFDVLFFVFFLEEAEAFAGEFRAIYILLIENIAKFLTAKTINTYLFMPDPAP